MVANLVVQIGNECRLISRPGRPVVVIDFTGTFAVFPIPVGARVLGRAFQPVLGKIDAVTAKRGVIGELIPWQRVMFIAEAEEPAETQHGIAYLTIPLTDHDPLDRADFFIVRPVDSRSLYFIATDQAGSLS